MVARRALVRVGGKVVQLPDGDTLAGYRTILNAQFDATSTATAYEPSLNALTYALRTNYTVAPVGNSEAIHPGVIKSFVVDTSQGNLVGEAHGIGELDVYSLIGGGTVNLLFGKETRIGLQGGTHLTEFLLHKWVMEPNATNNGTVDVITLDGLDDMSASAPYVAKFRKLYADPRMVEYQAGGQVIAPVIIDGNVTLEDKHSGKIIYLNSFSDVTVTVGTVSDGFRVKLVQGTLGGRITVAPGARTPVAVISRMQTQGSFDNVQLLAADGTSLMIEWPLSVKPIVGVDTATTRTLTLADGYLRMNNAAATTVTVPPQSSVAWPDDAEVLVEQMGAGQVTIAAGAGVTINTPGTLKVPGRYGSVMLKRTGLNTWTLRNAKTMIFDDLLVNAAATGTLNLDVGSAQVFDITLTGNTVINFTNIPVPVGQSYAWLLRAAQGATLRTLTINGVTTWITPGATFPGAPDVNKITEYIFSTQNGTTVLGRKGAYT